MPTANSAANAVTTVIGDPAKRSNFTWWESLKNSKLAAPIWTAMRVWLGVMWIQAGSSKLWGAESADFMHNNGAGVAGFAGHGTAAYSWWGSFNHSFVVPNAPWIAVIVALGEFCIGLGLVTGTFTRIAAVCSLILLFNYSMSGTASVTAFYALFALVVLVMWRTSSWIGGDGLIAAIRQRHPEWFTFHHHHGSGIRTTPAHQAA